MFKERETLFNEQLFGNEKRTKPKLHPSSFLIHHSNLRRIAFRAVEVVEVFGFYNAQTNTLDFLQKCDNEFFDN